MHLVFSWYFYFSWENYVEIGVWHVDLVQHCLRVFIYYFSNSQKTNSNYSLYFSKECVDFLQSNSSSFKPLIGFGWFFQSVDGLIEWCHILWGFRIESWLDLRWWNFRFDWTYSWFFLSWLSFFVGRLCDGFWNNFFDRLISAFIENWLL